MSADFDAIVGEWAPVILDYELYEDLRDTVLDKQDYPGVVQHDSNCFTTKFSFSQMTTSLDNGHTKPMYRSFEAAWLLKPRGEELDVKITDWLFTDSDLILNFKREYKLFTKGEEVTRATFVPVKSGAQMDSVGVRVPMLGADCLELTEMLRYQPVV